MTKYGGTFLHLVSLERLIRSTCLLGIPEAYEKARLIMMNSASYAPTHTLLHFFRISTSKEFLFLLDFLLFAPDNPILTQN